jgi:hypothetical protein
MSFVLHFENVRLHDQTVCGTNTWIARAQRGPLVFRGGRDYERPLQYGTRNKHMSVLQR